MKWTVACCMVSLTTPLYAADALLTPLLTPAPAFPAELIKSRYAGKVRAQLVIRPDGSVHETKAIESGHPLLAASVEQTLGQWRYKPWVGTLGAPSFISITVPVIFGSHGYRHFNTEVTVGLNNVRCGYLNDEVVFARRDYPKDPLSKIDVFGYTAQVLFSSHVARQRTEPERKALIEQLGAAIPTIVRNCKRNPEHRYGDYLPGAIKSLMVGLAEGSK